MRPKCQLYHISDTSLLWNKENITGSGRNATQNRGCLASVKEPPVFFTTRQSEMKGGRWHSTCKLLNIFWYLTCYPPRYRCPPLAHQGGTVRCCPVTNSCSCIVVLVKGRYGLHIRLYLGEDLQHQSWIGSTVSCCNSIRIWTLDIQDSLELHCFFKWETIK